MSCQEGKPTHKQHLKLFAFQSLKQRDLTVTLQKGRDRTKFMLIEYCLVGFKKTFPRYVVFAAGTARGSGTQTEIVKKKKPAEIAVGEGR